MIMTSKAFWGKLANEVCYLLSNYEEAAIRMEPGNSDYYVKFKGKPEFKAKPESSVVMEVLLERNFITKEQYENY